MKKSGPLLKAAFMEVVENQIRDDDPPETRATLKRLTSQGVSDDDARIFIGQAVCVEVWGILRNKKEFNMARYVRNLKNLPDEPQE
jgi:hypothetical protein